MASNIQFNISAFNRFLDRTVQPFLIKKAEEIVKEARENAPQGATGELKNSISVQRGARGRVSITVDAPHAGFVHQGTGLGHIPNPNAPYFPRLRKRGLIIWSDAKGVNPYKVAHGISKSGTPANPFLAEAVEKVLGRHQFAWIRRDLNV